MHALLENSFLEKNPPREFLLVRRSKKFTNTVRERDTSIIDVNIDLRIINMHNDVW